MRTLKTLILSLLMVTTLAACGNKTEGEMMKTLSEQVTASANASAVEKVPGFNEVLEGVLDDDIETAFIFCRSSKGGGDDNADLDRLVILLKRKKQWQASFPNKKIVAMSTFTERNKDSNYSAPLGLIIQYEKP